MSTEEYELVKARFEEEVKEDDFRFAILKKLRKATEPAGDDQFGGKTHKMEKSIQRITKLMNKLKRFQAADLENILSELDRLDCSMYLDEITEAFLNNLGSLPHESNEVVPTIRIKDILPFTSVIISFFSYYGNDSFRLPIGEKLEKTFKEASDVARKKAILRLVVELQAVQFFKNTRFEQLLASILKDILDDPDILAAAQLLSMLSQKYAGLLFHCMSELQKKHWEALKAEVSREVTGTSFLADRQVVFPQNGFRDLVKHFVVRANGYSAELSKKVEVIEQQNVRMEVMNGVTDPEVAEELKHLRDIRDKLITAVTGIVGNLNLHTGVEKPKEEGLISDSCRKTMGNNRVLLMIASQIEDSSGNCRFIHEEERRMYSELPTIDDEIVPVEGTPKEADQFFDKLDVIKHSKDADRLSHVFWRKFNTKVYRKRLSHVLTNLRPKQIHYIPLIIRLIATLNQHSAKFERTKKPKNESPTETNLFSPSIGSCKIGREVTGIIASTAISEIQANLADKNPSNKKKELQTIALKITSELVKFQLLQPAVILGVIRNLLDDFTTTNAEYLIYTFTQCGRYLMYSPQTFLRTYKLVEILKRVKSNKNLAHQMEVSVDNCIESLVPALDTKETQSIHVISKETHFKGVKDEEEYDLNIYTGDSRVFESLERIDYHSGYTCLEELFCQRLIIYLIYVMDMAKVAALVRKLPWQSEHLKIAEWLKFAIVFQVHLHANFNNLRIIAELMAELMDSHSEFVIDVVDTVLEEIHVGIERTDHRSLARLVLLCKLYTEFFNLRIVDTNSFLGLVYHLIGMNGASSYNSHTQAHVKSVVLEQAKLRATFGHSDTEDVTRWLPAIIRSPKAMPDPPWQYTHVCLVCETFLAAVYSFKSGKKAMRESFQCFIIFFQRYCHSRLFIPVSVQALLLDVIEAYQVKKLTLEECDAFILLYLHDTDEAELPIPTGPVPPVAPPPEPPRSPDLDCQSVYDTPSQLSEEDSDVNSNDEDNQGVYSRVFIEEQNRLEQMAENELDNELKDLATQCLGTQREILQLTGKQAPRREFPNLKKFDPSPIQLEQIDRDNVNHFKFVSRKGVKLHLQSVKE